jgi:hypothetical protein
MFNSTVLDVAIGLIFTFLAISIAVSAIVEMFASAMKWRSSTLLSGIKDLLNDPDFSGLALAIYNHALVNPQDAGTAKNEKEVVNPPAYMEPSSSPMRSLTSQKLHKTPLTRSSWRSTPASATNN